jgi:hypothetical protein
MGMATIVDLLLAEAGIHGLLEDPVPGVEAVQRGERVFLINHGSQSVNVDGTELASQEVHIARVTLC